MLKPRMMTIETLRAQTTEPQPLTETRLSGSQLPLKRTRLSSLPHYVAAAPRSSCCDSERELDLARLAMRQSAWACGFEMPRYFGAMPHWRCCPANLQFSDLATWAQGTVVPWPLEVRLAWLQGKAP